MTTTQIVLIAGLMVTAAPLPAQSAAEQMTRLARAHIDALRWDSAATLLQASLTPQARATDAERLRAFTLLAVTELSRENRTGARQAFAQALRLERGMSIDSLADLHTDVRVVFAEARSELGLPALVAVMPAFTVDITVPADTSIVLAAGGLPITAVSTAPARIVMNISPADAPQTILWSAQLGGAARYDTLWTLRDRDGHVLPSGRYALRTSATDSAGQVSPTVERILLVSRGVPDTSQLPAPPPPGAFRPETVAVRPGRIRSLIVGALLGATLVMVPPIMSVDQAKGETIPVGGVLLGAGVIGFLTGHRRQPSADNALFNQQVRARHILDRAEALARAIDLAPVRVQLEGASR